METHKETSSSWDIFLRTIAVLGLIAVLLLGAWGIIQLAVSLPSVFGSIGGGVSSLFTSNSSKETLTVSAPTSVSSGQSTTVSWTHQNGSGDYAYTLSYGCQNGLSVKAPLPNGSYQTIACNTPFNFVNADAHMTLVPTVTGSQSAPLAFSVSATKLSTGVIGATGSATTQITPNGSVASNTSATATPKPKPTTTSYPSTSYTTSPSVVYQPAPVRAAFYGLPDLAVVYNSSIPTSNGLTKVTFTVENNGTNVTPTGWTFNAQLPINGSYTFASQPQRALNPGDKIVYTLSYSGGTQYNYPPQNQYPAGYNNGYGYTTGTSYTGSSYYTGNGGYTCNNYGPCINTNYNTPITYPTSYGYNNGTVTIIVDPQNYIQEYNKANNTISFPVLNY